MRRVISVAIGTVFVLGLSACGSGGAEMTEAVTKTASTSETTSVPEITTSSEMADEDRLRVCMIYEGSADDELYRESWNAGAKQAADDFEIELQSVESSDSEELETDFLAACEDGYDLVIGVAPAVADYAAKYGADYPDIRFVVIDATIGLSNVQTVSFAQDEGYFLAGAAAAMFTEKTEIDGINEEVVIGWVGGMDIPIIREFFAGYEQGAKYINPDITILESYAGSWSDSMIGKELALAQFDQGADIIMNAAYGMDAGVLEAAEEKGLYVIGAGRNQDLDQSGAVLTSLVKRADNVCYQIIKSAAEDTFQGGTVRCFSLKDGAISLTDFSVIKERLGARFPQDIADRCEELVSKLISGEIVIDNGIEDSEKL